MLFDYLSTVALVDGVVGNSLSGLAEVPSFRKGTINIGDRQRGRLMADSVINCDPERASISAALHMRISEPVPARLDDLVLDHDIPHLWVRKNSLTDRKTQASIRCVPLLGVSPEVAQELHRRAVRQKSDWLMPQYASETGNTSCAAALNKYMRHLDFRTHMFRHSFIDRLKDCGDVPVPIAEAITGHGRNTSEFARYDSVG
jgi:integrase